jgi:hypothetical protein
MTRTIEHLQLSKEEEDEYANRDEDENHDIGSVEFLIQKMAFLEPANDWVQREERHCIFWNVFLMDRFVALRRAGIRLFQVPMFIDDFLVMDLSGRRRHH